MTQPATTAQPAKKLLYYFKVEITVEPQNMPQFISVTEQLLPMVEAQNKWKLIAALSSVTGTPTVVTHLWQLADANALLEGMQYLASDPVGNLYGRLLALSKQSRQELYTAMKYNPLGANVMNI